MSSDPQPVASECGKCGKPSVQERPNPDAESDGNDGSQAAASSTPPLPSCCCCSQEDSVATALERDSTDEVPMDIDNDLTTNERMPTVDELEHPNPKPKLKPLEVVKREYEEKLLVVEPAEQKPLAEEEQEQSTKAPRSPTPIKIEEEEEEKPKEKQQQQQQLQEQQLQSQEDMPPSSPEAQPNPSHRVGKITRSSLNGNQSSTSTRTPAIMKRLRKSTRFKAKPTGGRGNSAAGNNNNQSNGHNNGPNNGASGSSTHLAGAGAHPSNTNKHGKSGTGGSSGGGGSPAARSRRTLFKRPTTQKTPKVQASTRFVKSVFYKGSYMQIGDIVSIVDGEQNLYYAQIRGLLVDAYCEKSAFLTWLIPTQDSPDPQEGFDPATYLIGPDEELSRKLCYLEFVMHAPSNYYFDRSTPFPLPDVDEYTAQRSGGFIWTRLPVVKREKGEREREREREREMRGRDSAHKASGAS